MAQQHRETAEVAQMLGLLAAEEDCWGTAGLQALSDANIYPSYDLLESVKRPVLQIQNCRTSMTQGNSRISETSPTPHNLLNGDDDGAKLQFQENCKVQESKHPMATYPTPLSNSQSGYKSRVKAFRTKRTEATISFFHSWLKQGQGRCTSTKAARQGRNSGALKWISLTLSPDIRLSDMPKFFWSLRCWACGREHSACFSGCFTNSDDVSGALALVWFLQPGSRTGE
uniref:uncharacterized protein LOC117718694 n=1 Tax=Arvicanthis niloticus TaxID=61156 RepID=UPI001486440D|nr:uncharacterized protein LOC117718694 [Arvicanthis niloticus]